MGPREYGLLARQGRAKASASAAGRAVLIRTWQVLSPIRSDTLLGSVQGHPSGLHLVRQIVLYTILHPEIAIGEHGCIRTTLGPYVPQSIGTAKFKWYEVVQFANLVFPGIPMWSMDAVPAIGHVLLGLAALAVANRPGSPSWIAEDCCSHRWIDATRSAPRIGNRVSTSQRCATGFVGRFLPRSKILRCARQSRMLALLARSFRLTAAISPP